MATELAAAYVTLIPSLKGAGKTISHQLSAGAAGAETAGKKTGSKFSAGMRSGLAGMGAAFASAKLVGFFRDSVGAASDLNETVNKSRTIFGDQAAGIEAWASSAATNLGMSRQAALDAAAGFGDMFSQLGFGGGAAADMSKAVVQMATDLGSFNNLPTEDVADRLSAAFRGEFDSLQALIPNINAARVEQVALEMTGKKSAKALTAQEKAAATLAIVQKDGARASDDFAKTSDGLANSQKIIGAQFADMKATLGNQLLPIVAKASTLFAVLMGWLQKNPAVMKALALIVGGVLVVALGAAAAAAWSFTVALLANPATWIAAAIIAAIVGIILVIKNWGKITKWLRKMWASFASWIGGVWDGIRSAIVGAATAVRDFLAGIWGAIVADAQAAGAWLRGVWDTVAGAVAGVWRDISQAVIGAARAIWGVVLKVWRAIAAATKLAWRVIMLAIRPQVLLIRFLVTTIFRLVQAIILRVWDVITKITAFVWPYIAGIIRRYLTLIRLIVSTVFNAIRAVITTALNIIRAVFSRVWAAIRTATSAVWGVIVGIVRTYVNLVRTIISTVLGTLREIVSRVWTRIREATKTAWDAVARVVGTAIDTVAGIVRDLGGKVADAVGKLKDAAARAGQAIVDGITGAVKAGMKGFVDLIAKPVQDAVDKVVDIIKPGSPSRVFTALGRSIPQGLAAGVGQDSGLVDRAMSTLPLRGLNVGSMGLDVRVPVALPNDVEIMARLSPEDIVRLGNYILSGSQAMARGEVIGLGRGLRAGVRA